MSAIAPLHSEKEVPQPAVTASNQGVNEYEDAEKNYQPKTIKFWLILIGVFLSLFLVALDRAVIATAIPRITDDFHSIQEIGWYGSAYMLAAAPFFPICGPIYKLYSPPWVFVISILVFEAGSALCGAAPTSAVLIAGRAISGLASSSIITGGVVMVLPIVPLRKRPVYNSLFGVSFMVASVLGPVIGGALTSHVSWRWCFYINLPIGGVTMAIIILLFPKDTAKRAKLSAFEQIRKLDPIGALLLFPSIVSLVLALQWGGSIYHWSAPRVIGLLVTFAILLVAFCIYEALTPTTAMIPSRIVLNRSVAGIMLFALLLSGGMQSILYYLAAWFQAVKGDSPIHAGVSTLPLAVTLITMGVISGIFTQKFRYYGPSLLITPVLSSVGAGLLTTLTPKSNHSAWIGYQVLYGLGTGAGFQSSNLVPQNVLSRMDVPVGVALVFFMQQLGGSIFLAVSQNLFESHLVHQLAGIAGLDTQIIIDTGATALRTIVPADEQMTVIAAYNDALTRVFILVAALNAATIIGAVMVEWKKIEGKDEDKEHVESPELAAEKVRDEDGARTESVELDAKDVKDGH